MDSVWMVGLVFFLRIIDVSMGTIRHIVSVQGRAFLAASIGFFEVIIFLVAISQVLDSVRENFWLALAYGGGFATGTWLGVKLEERIALGMRMTRVITTQPNDELVVALRGKGFGVTVLQGEGLSGPVYVLFSVVKRCLVPNFRKVVRELAPQAFFTIEDTRFVSSGGGLMDRMGK